MESRKCCMIHKGIENSELWKQQKEPSTENLPGQIRAHCKQTGLKWERLLCRTIYLGHFLSDEWLGFTIIMRELLSTSLLNLSSLSERSSQLTSSVAPISWPATSTRDWKKVLISFEELISLLRNSTTFPSWQTQKINSVLSIAMKIVFEKRSFNSSWMSSLSLPGSASVVSKK